MLNSSLQLEFTMLLTGVLRDPRIRGRGEDCIDSLSENNYTAIEPIDFIAKLIIVN